MSDHKRTFVRSNSPDELFKNTMALHYLQQIFARNSNLIDFDDVKKMVEYIDFEESYNFMENITAYIKKSLEIKGGGVNESQEFFDTIPYEIERRFRDDRIVNQEVKKRLLKFISDNLEVEKASDNSEWYMKVKEIAEIFRLNPTEFKLLIFFGIYDTESDFSSFFDNLIDHNPIARKGKIEKKIFASVLEIGISEVAALFSADSNLIKYGLLDEDYSIEPTIILYLEGISKDAFTSRYYKIFDKNVIDINNFTIETKDVSMIERMLTAGRSSENGFKILLYGKPGTGKTEFARSICATHNYKTYELNQINKNNGSDLNNDKFRLQGLYAFKTIASDEPSVMIIDEADDFLKSSECGMFGSQINEERKGIINSCLDELKYNQIWIINNSRNLDESTKRRFDYSIEFSDFSFNQRKSIWKNIIEKSHYAGIIDENDLNYLTDKYQVNAGIIAKAVENCVRVYKPDTDKREMIDILEDSLNSHINLLTGRRTSAHSNKEPNFSGYSIEGLNIKGDLNSYLTLLDRFNTAWENNNTAIRNMNVLMWGPPGTGKTELAKYVARRLRRKLIIKTASDILDKYVGETEENIAQAFREAEREKALLFIDEIDGLLANRGNAQRTWEVTQVNELLVRMENFNGILLCATNFIENVDTAAARRFNIKIEFDYLNDSGVDFFYDLFFGKLNGTLPDETQRRVLRSIKHLTPGDFKVVYQKVAIFGEDKLDPAAIIGSLSDEAKLKNKSANRIGF